MPLTGTESPFPYAVFSEAKTDLYNTGMEYRVPLEYWPIHNMIAEYRHALAEEVTALAEEGYEQAIIVCEEKRTHLKDVIARVEAELAQSISLEGQRCIDRLKGWDEFKGLKDSQDRKGPLWRLWSYITQ